MTYLEILSYARKGIQADIDYYRAMQEKALQSQAHNIAHFAQISIDALDVKYATLNEIEEIHNRK